MASSQASYEVPDVFKNDGAESPVSGDDYDENTSNGEFARETEKPTSSFSTSNNNNNYTSNSKQQQRSSSSTSSSSSSTQQTVWNALYRLAMWRDVYLSAGAFAAFNVLFLSITWFNYSLLTLVSYLGMAAIASTVVYTYGSEYVEKFTGRRLPIHRVEPKQLYVSGERLQYWGNRFAPVFNRFVDHAIDALYLRDITMTARVFAVLFVLSKIGMWFTLPGLTYTLGFAFFTVPYTWMRYRDQIKAKAQPVLQNAMRSGMETAKKINEAIPRASTASSSNDKVKSS